MSAHFVPAHDPNKARIGKIKATITKVLDSHISGRGKDTKISKAADDLIIALTPLLKIPSKADKGATVMTEAASHKREDGSFGKGPSNL